MKFHKIDPTAVEKVLPEDEYIISTSDLKGRITSVNDVFVTYSGYGRDELINSPHSIVRHPDMPRAVFLLLWDTLISGEEFFGYVKNLCKDGSYYWVAAHILPEYDGSGNTVSYRSVRRAPKRDTINLLEPLYAKMKSAEQGVPSTKAPQVGLEVLGGFLVEQGMTYEQLVARI